MAALILGFAGEAIGGAIGGTFLGVSAAAWGGLVGATIGNYLDSALFVRKQQGPKLQQLPVMTANEGDPMTRGWGRFCVPGELIWATSFLEHQTTTTTGGGKGIGGGAPKTETTTYTYTVSFAVGLCEGVAKGYGRIWADGNPMDLSAATVRFYPGDDTQTTDPKIAAVEGAANAYPFRGLAYLVFEDLDLTPFGNRIPQLLIEVFKPIDDATGIENLITAIDMIPASGEFVYGTTAVVRSDGEGSTQPENVINNRGIPNFEASLDDLIAAAPNLEMVNIVVAWFGDDLRAGSCLIKPKVETSTKSTSPYSWSVNGITRAGAATVTLSGGVPAYGGTPCDRCVAEAIVAIKSRGLKVALYPLILMDIASGNSLPNPYSNNAATNGQPDYPWRGRITVSPAAGYTGTVDKTATAATQINSFFGSASASDLSVSGTGASTQVSWTGGTDWGFRRMVLHYAKLGNAAASGYGGLDAILIGSELRGITTARSAAGTFPAVAGLATLASDVKGIVGSGCVVTYGADWSEYFGHQPADGSGDVYFHLDDLWSDSHIDAVGIDNYMPLSDWRDGTTHLDYDAVNGPTQITDLDYLRSQIEGGEGFDYYYASSNDRDAQTRTPIADGTYGKPWVFRFKDIRSWWLNNHYNRPLGVESGTPTSWTPQSKPFWFTECGCPAVDKGTNQPNVFFDPKSSESSLPYYSSGDRADMVQRRYLEALIGYWSDTSNNPLASGHAWRMVDATRLFCWTWDARPYPDFPARETVWADAPNYRLGHWLNGRLGNVSLAPLVREIALWATSNEPNVSDITGVVTGYSVSGLISSRDALQPLMDVYFFDAIESLGLLKFIPRYQLVTDTIEEDELVLSSDDEADSHFELGPLKQEAELPQSIKLSFLDIEQDYANATVEGRRTPGSGFSASAVSISTPVIESSSTMQGVADVLLRDAWAKRDSGTIYLPPSKLKYDPGDAIVLDVGGRQRIMQMGSVNDALFRKIGLTSYEPQVLRSTPGAARNTLPPPVNAFGPVALAFMDLPLLSQDALPQAVYVAAFHDPWPGAIDIFRSSTGASYDINAVVASKAVMGVTLWDLYAGPSSRWDSGNYFQVRIFGGELSSADELDVFAGANTLAIEQVDGSWEILQFKTATLVDTLQYELHDLLRGQLGTENHMGNPVPAGARIVLLDPTTISQLNTALGERTLDFFYSFGPANKPITDSSYQIEEHAFVGNGLKPYAPCHVQRKRTSGGDDVIRWIRRTRIGGDDWEAAEVPLGEDIEAYEVDITDGSGNVLRTLSVSNDTTVTYAAGDQTTDFGGAAPNDLVVRVYQLSQIFGRGEVAEVHAYLGLYYW